MPKDTIASSGAKHASGLKEFAPQKAPVVGSLTSSFEELDVLLDTQSVSITELSHTIAATIGLPLDKAEECSKEIKVSQQRSPMHYRLRKAIGQVREANALIRQLIDSIES